jgi:anti-anti-sigma factor
MPPPPPVFRVAVGYDRSGTPRMELEGELDIASLGRLRRLFDAAIVDGVRVVLDLARLRFVDLPGVRLLLELRGVAARHACDFELSGATGQVARLLEFFEPRQPVPAVA